MPAPIKVIVDTDIGEDIDDILATAFALRSPELVVAAITTVDGDTEGRSRIARKLLAVMGSSEIPVAAGYQHSMPRTDLIYPPGTAVRQGEVAPGEEGLPAAAALRADELIARQAAQYPGEITVVTIGSMTNVAMALVRYPETAANIRGIVTNGGQFSGRPVEIGWNLRYDPIAAVVVASSGVPWTLLPENTTRFAGLRAEEEQRLRQVDTPLARLLTQAIDAWRRNKADATPTPHLSDLNVFAYLLGWVKTRRGRAILTTVPGGLAGLDVQDDPEGPHLLGEEIPPEQGAALRELWMRRIMGLW